MKRLALAAALVVPIALAASAAVRPAAESATLRAETSAASRCPFSGDATVASCPHAGRRSGPSTPSAEAAPRCPHLAAKGERPGTAGLSCPARQGATSRAAETGAAPRGRCPAASRSLPSAPPLAAAGGGVV